MSAAHDIQLPGTNARVIPEANIRHPSSDGAGKAAAARLPEPDRGLAHRRPAGRGRRMTGRRRGETREQSDRGSQSGS
jgi:hypothetical protein